MATRALTVTTTKLIVNMVCAATMVQKPSDAPMLRNCASSDAPSTTSGVAIGRKMRTLIAPRALNRCRTRA